MRWPSSPSSQLHVTALLMSENAIAFNSRKTRSRQHGLAPDRGVAWWQHRLTPCWKCLGGGCHLNRKIDDLITAAGFHIEKLDTGYMQGRNPFAFMYEGVARPAN
jgi:hypothetical protein